MGHPIIANAPPSFILGASAIKIRSEISTIPIGASSRPAITWCLPISALAGHIMAPTKTINAASTNTWDKPPRGVKCRIIAMVWSGFAKINGQAGSVGRSAIGLVPLSTANFKRRPSGTSRGPGAVSRRPPDACSPCFRICRRAVYCDVRILLSD